MTEELNQEQEDNLGAIVNHFDKLIQDSEIARNYMMSVQWTYYDRQYDIISRVLHITLFGEQFWDDVQERALERDYQCKEGMVCEAPMLYDIFPNNSLHGINMDTEDYCTPPSESDEIISKIREKVYWEIVDYVAKVDKYDFEALKYTRRLMLGMGKDEQAEFVEGFIEKLIKKEYNIGGNYIEKQEVKYYGEGK